jgi:hypothetical protein
VPVFIDRGAPATITNNQHKKKPLNPSGFSKILELPISR